jgi:hypothetical protein
VGRRPKPSSACSVCRRRHLPAGRRGCCGCPLAAAWHAKPMWPPERTGRRSVLDESLCCGIDAEWPPEETTQEAQRGSPPHATLVQLALWLPPGSSCIPALDDADGWRVGAGGASSSSASTGRCCALLLDMLSLPPAETRQALQALFRCSADRCLCPAPCPFCVHASIARAAVCAAWLAAATIQVVTPYCSPLHAATCRHTQEQGLLEAGVWAGARLEGHSSCPGRRRRRLHCGWVREQQQTGRHA